MSQQKEEKGLFDDEEFPNLDEQQTEVNESSQTNQTNLIGSSEARQEQKQERQTFTYDEDLWDSLPAIQNHSKRGQQLLFGFIHFAKNYTKVLQTFGHGLQKCNESFEREMLSQQGFDTTTIAITSIKNGVNELVSSIQDKINLVFGDMIEPIEMYYKHYQQTNNDQLAQAKKYWNDLEDSKKRLNYSKERYYKLMHDIELSELSIEQSLLEHEKGDLSIEQVQKITNATLNIKYKAEVAQQDYKKEIDQLNFEFKRFEDEYKPLLQAIQQGEESRINFLKYNFEKFIKHLNQFGKNISEKTVEMQSQVTMINSETDLKIFIDEHRTHSEFLRNVEYQPFQYSVEIQKQKAELIKEINKYKTFDHNEEFEVLEEGEEDLAEKMNDYLQNLMGGLDIDMNEKEKIIASLHRTQVRETVADFLKIINSPKNIENPEALKTLGEIIKYLLTAFVHEKDENFKVVQSILNASQLIFHIKENKETKEKHKVYLTSYLNDHGIWQEKQMWKTIVQKYLNQRFQEAVQQPGLLSQKVQSQIQQPQSSFNTGIFGQLGKLKGAFFGKDEHQQQNRNQDQQQNSNNKSSQGSIRIQKSLAQNIIFNAISKFIYHFVNFQFPFQQAKDVVLLFCDKYELDQNRTHLLLSELESLQRKTKVILTEKDFRNISLDKRQKRINKYGDQTGLIISQTLNYVDCDVTIRNLLCLNKSTNQLFKKKAYKQALLFSQIDRIKQKRIPIWNLLLQINKNQSDYEAFKNKVANDSQLIENVEEVINMDVQRSFTKMKSLNPQVLTNILKTYAYFNPEVEYCQGMNFIAGFLYLVFKDEEVAFKALQQIVEQFNMSQLFNQDLPKLKLFFYQLDRLVSVWIPQLHSHFKDEMITSSYYCSAWFITVFTNSLQNQEGEEVGEKLLQLWDYYLTVNSGWKAIFMMGLILLKEKEQLLLFMSFEEILNFINERPKQILVQNEEAKSKSDLLYHQLKHQSNDMVDLSYLLNLLEKEFNDSLQTAQDTNSKIQQRKQQKQAQQLQNMKEEHKTK